VNDIQNEGRRLTMAEVVVPGHKKLYEKVTGKPYVNASLARSSGSAELPSMMAGDSMMMMAGGVKAERVIIPGFDRKELSPEERKAEEEKRQAAYREEAEYYGIPEKQQRDYFRARAQQSRDYLRSAELESPAPRGHPLRDFGQSDRETIENANYDASVPQSLFMMNGSLMPNILGRYSQLMLAISKAQYPDDKLDTAYMAILARKPTQKEKEAWLKAQGLPELEVTDRKDFGMIELWDDRAIQVVQNTGICFLGTSYFARPKAPILSDEVADRTFVLVGSAPKTPPAGPRHSA
jgi:hypothetical protein